MKYEGYVLSDYNASYVEATFDVRTRQTDKNDVLDITELNSGERFIVLKERKHEKQRKPIPKSENTFRSTK